MAEVTRTGVYRGASEAEATAEYHAEAARAASEGFVPVSEQWSTALGQSVLTVSYVHAPDQAPAILEMLRRQPPPAPRQPVAAGEPGPAAHSSLGTYPVDRRAQASLYRRQVGWGCLGRLMVAAGLVLGFIVAALFAAQLTSNILLQLLLAFVVGPAVGGIVGWYLWTEAWGRR
jgi:hypothetical protein